ncbi:MAG: hypothetical protein ACKVOI_12235 [Dongiaceae bacterium]
MKMHLFELGLGPMAMATITQRSSHAAFPVSILLIALGMMLASCREESGTIPPGVYIEGIDGDPYGDLDAKVPVYYQGDADLGSYESLGTVSNSAQSDSCRPAHRSGAARAMAISGLRRRVLELGGNGMMNVDCSVTGSSSYGASDQDLRDFQEWLDCLGRNRDEEMRRNGRAPINGDCEHLRAELPDRTYETPQCHQTAKCSATAIRREVPVP